MAVILPIHSWTVAEVCTYTYMEHALIRLPSGEVATVTDALNEATAIPLRARDGSIKAWAVLDPANMPYSVADVR